MKGSGRSAGFGAPPNASRAAVQYSFDIFDTVLTRMVAEPTALFLFLGTRAMRAGLIQVTPEQFARYRVTCERRARLNSRHPEITLEEIYLELQYALGCSDSAMSVLLHEELALEKEFIRPVPTIQRLLAQARADAGRVLFVSEMYLPGAFLESLLRQHGMYEDGDRVHVSSEHRAQKHDGRLYRAVLRAEGLEPRHLVHTGDNYQLDVRVPRRIGMQARHFSDAAPNIYEAQLNRQTFETGGVSSLLAGISRLTRLKHTASGDVGAIASTGAAVAAPVLLLVALWLCDEARKLGLKRLYFTTRDGHVLRRVVAGVAADAGCGDLDLRLLFGSRQAWYPATLSVLDERTWDSLVDLRSVNDTVANIFERLLLAPEDYCHELEDAGFPESLWHRALTRGELSHLKRLVLGSAGMRVASSEALSQRAELILRYCQAEGLYDDEPKGIIDSGWSGRWHEPILAAIEKAGHFIPIVLFVGHRAGVPVGFAPRTFLFDQRLGRGFAATLINITRVVELFCLSDGGRTTGYRDEGGIVRPVIATSEYAEFQERAYPALSQAIDRYLEESRPFLEYIGRPADGGAMAMTLLTQFWTAPTASEARAWKQYDYIVDHVGERIRPLAVSLGLRHVARMFVCGSPSSDPELWPGGSHQASRWDVRVALTLARKARTFLRDIRTTVRRHAPWVHPPETVRTEPSPDIGVPNAPASARRSRDSIARFLSEQGGVWAAMGVFLVALVTLFPYDFSAADPLVKLRQQFLAGPSFETRHLISMAANLALFLPVGMGLAAMFAGREMPSRRALVATGLLSCALSLFVEFLQGFVPDRNPSAIDVLTNTASGLLGWWCFHTWNPRLLRLMEFTSGRPVIPARMSALVFAAVLTAGFLLPVPFHRTATVADWDPTYPLLIGNERTGDRQWEGEIYQIEIAARAVDPGRAHRVFEGGLSAVLPGGVLVSYDFSAQNERLQDRAGHAGILASPPAAAAEPIFGAQGLMLKGAAWLETVEPAAALVRAIQTTGQFTISIVCAPMDSGQKGPARIVSVSIDPGYRNFTIGQQEDQLVVRVRTPISGLNAAERELRVPGVFGDGMRRHLVVTFDGYNILAMTDEAPGVHRLELGLGPGSSLARRFFSADVSRSAEHEGLYRLAVFLPLGALAALIAVRRRGAAGAALLLAAILVPPALHELLWAVLHSRSVDIHTMALSAALITGPALLVFGAISPPGRPDMNRQQRAAFR